MAAVIVILVVVLETALIGKTDAVVQEVPPESGPKP